MTIIIVIKSKYMKKKKRNRKSEEETHKYNKLLIMITNGMHNESSQRFNHFYRISER